MNVQNFIESRLERRAKGVFAPSGGKFLLCFLDDLNMPVSYDMDMIDLLIFRCVNKITLFVYQAKDIYGSQPPLELIRQWLDYKFWYDRGNQTAKLISVRFWCNYLCLVMVKAYLQCSVRLFLEYVPCGGNGTAWWWTNSDFPKATKYILRN